MLERLLLTQSGILVRAFLGGGKTMLGVLIARLALIEGRKVATNIDLYYEKMHLPDYDTNPEKYHKLLIHLPNKVRLTDLEALGHGASSRTEPKGILIIDEFFTHYGNRSWNSKDNEDLKNWMIYSRKRRWNVIFISQSRAIDKQILETFCMYEVVLRGFNFFGLTGRFHYATIAKRAETSDSLKFRYFWITIFCSRAIGLIQSIIYRSKPTVYDMYDTEEDLSKDIYGQPFYAMTGEVLTPQSIELDDGDKKLVKRITWQDVKNIKWRKLFFSPDAFLLIPIIVLLVGSVWGIRGMYSMFLGNAEAQVAQPQTVSSRSVGCETSNFFQLASTFPALNNAISSDVLLSLLRYYVPVLVNVSFDNGLFGIDWYDNKMMVDSTSSQELEFFGWFSKVTKDGVILSSGELHTIFLPLGSSKESLFNSYVYDSGFVPCIGDNLFDFSQHFQYQWYSPTSSENIIAQYLGSYKVDLSSVSFRGNLLYTFALVFSDNKGVAGMLTHFQIEPYWLNLKRAGWKAYSWHGGLVLQYGKHLYFLRFNPAQRGYFTAT